MQDLEKISNLDLMIVINKSKLNMELSNNDQVIIAQSVIKYVLEINPERM